MAQARTEFAAALNQIASEKGVDPAVVLDAIKQAALAAYKKDLILRKEPVPEDFEEFTSEVDPASGEISIFQKDKNVTPPGFARIAASIAKQVIMQRLNEAERDAILSEYSNKVGTVISGNIQRQEGSIFFIDLGRAEGIFPPSEQVHTEIYHQNQRLKFLIKEIREGGRGSEVVVSRADPELVKALFALEVPEIQSGSVEIKAIAREAGSRTKIAAISTQDGVDPVGSLVGQKGVRVQAVMSELGEEKIDIIAYSDDPARFIAASLSPAKDVIVVLDKENQIATVTVVDAQLSLAIGKKGQNVRLAAKLTGWKIDIVGSGDSETSDSVKSKSSVPESQKESVDMGAEEDIKEPQSGVQQLDDNQIKTEKKLEVIPAETTQEGGDKAREEATDPSKTPSEAIAEAGEENITEAQQQESKIGELEEVEDQPEGETVQDAEVDMEKSDKQKG